MPTCPKCEKKIETPLHKRVKTAGGFFKSRYFNLVYCPECDTILGVNY